MSQTTPWPRSAWVGGAASGNWPEATCRSSTINAERSGRRSRSAGGRSGVGGRSASALLFASEPGSGWGFAGARGAGRCDRGAGRVGLRDGTENLSLHLVVLETGVGQPGGQFVATLMGGVGVRGGSVVRVGRDRALSDVPQLLEFLNAGGEPLDVLDRSRAVRVVVGGAQTLHSLVLFGAELRLQRADLPDCERGPFGQLALAAERGGVDVGDVKAVARLDLVGHPPDRVRGPRILVLPLPRGEPRLADTGGVGVIPPRRVRHAVDRAQRLAPERLLTVKLRPRGLDALAG